MGSLSRYLMGGNGFVRKQRTAFLEIPGRTVALS
jgi:hypothetical protein